MDDTQGGILLIATSMIVLVAFAVTVFAVMVIYRRRKLQHTNEISLIQERFKHELLLTQLEVQQQTMQHIAQEIHDNVGQQLTLAVLYTQQLNPWDEKSEKKIESIATTINDSLTDLRTLSRSLANSDALADSSLIEILHRECLKVESTGKCAVGFVCRDATLQVSPVVKSVVLRIIQEFLKNSLTHSSCTKITMLIESSEGGALTVIAEDNGLGFVLHDETKHGIGLKNMKTRAKIINAGFEIASVPGSGTKMRLVIPLQQLVNTTL
jgi:signal transduction histidine kinase